MTKQDLIKDGFIILTEEEFSSDCVCKKCESTAVKFVKKIEIDCECKFSLRKKETYLELLCLDCKQKMATKI